MIIRSLEEHHAARIIIFNCTELEVDCDRDFHLEKYVVLEIAVWPIFPY